MIAKYASCAYLYSAVEFVWKILLTSYMYISIYAAEKISRNLLISDDQPECTFAWLLRSPLDYLGIDKNVEIPRM